MSASHLAIQVTEQTVHFVSFRNSIIVHQYDFVLDSKDPQIIREQINQEISERSFLQDDFDDITLSWSSKRSTLVPNAIFADSSADDIFSLCYGKDATEHDIDYNRIAELSIINVYEIPDWVKRFFVLKFPRVSIQHEGSHIIRQIMHNNAFKLKATIVLYQGYFQLTLVKHNNLEFYSFFDYQSGEDVLYHLMFTLQQKELTNEAGSIEIISGAASDQTILTSLKQNISRIKDLEKLEVNTPENYLSKAQFLCV